MAYETETDHETQYCFPAINSSCIRGKRSRHEYNIMYVFFSLLSAWTVFLNLLVIISISHFKKLHTPTNLIIVSLAVADMLVGLIAIPVDAIKLIESCWYFGHTICRWFLIIMGLLVSASLSNLVLIAIDRYVAVCHPLLYPKKITTTKTLVSICLCWLCSSAYNIISLSYGSDDMSHRSDACYGECPLVLKFALGVSDLGISFLFPCTLIITLYLRIFYVVHQQVKVINAFMKNDKCETKGSVKRKSESKAALTLGIIVTVYLLCWIPFYILSLTENSVPSASDFLTWCVYINSSLNPIVYALFYPWFRTTVKHILTLQIFKPASSLVNVLTDYS